MRVDFVILFLKPPTYNLLKENNIEVDFENSLMFSDSLSDKPLLDLVGKGYLINYKKRADYEILNWK